MRHLIQIFLCLNLLSTALISQDDFKSVKGKIAYKAFLDEISKADRELQKAKNKRSISLLKAKVNYIKALKAAKATILRKGDLDEANRLNDAIKSLELEIKTDKERKTLSRKKSRLISAKAKIELSSNYGKALQQLTSGEEYQAPFAFHTKWGADQYALIELAKDKYIDKISIKNRTDKEQERIIGASLEYSLDKEKWEEIAVIKDSQKEEAIITFEPVKAKYIRLRLPRNGMIVLKYFMIYGY